MQGTGDVLSLGIDIGGTSIKGAVMEGEQEVWRGRSGEYARPGRGELGAALGVLVGGVPQELMGRVGAVGVCAPGMRDERGVIVRAVNVPGLEGARAGGLVFDALRALGATFAEREGGGTFEFTDAHAAAVDWWRGHPGKGRVLALSLGTGVGACVLDEPEGRGELPRQLIVSGGGPGHLGQLYVGVLEEQEELNLPGGCTLEAYMGLPALRARFGDDLAGVIGGAELRAERVQLRALVTAIRVAHAIYRPARVVLLGGVGLALRPVAEEIRAAVADGLTELAREGWTLEVGDTHLHAARGAAWMAGRSG